MVKFKGTKEKKKKGKETTHPTSQPGIHAILSIKKWET